MLANLFLFTSLGLIFPFIISIVNGNYSKKGVTRYLPALLGASIITLLYLSLALAQFI